MNVMNQRLKLMAVSGPFQIELMEYVGTNDYKVSN